MSYGSAPYGSVTYGQQAVILPTIVGSMNQTLAKMTFTSATAADQLSGSLSKTLAAIQDTLAATIALAGDLRRTLTAPDTVNPILWSDDFNNAIWTKVSSPVITTDADIAPDGTLSADVITDNSTSVYSGATQVVTIPNDGLTRCFSIHVKKTTGGVAPVFGVNLGLSGGSSVSTTPRLDTDAGTGVSVEDAGDYWRMYRAITNNSSGNTSFVVSLYPAVRPAGGGSDTVTTTGSATIWGAQLDLGWTPQPYRRSLGTPGTGTKHGLLGTATGAIALAATLSKTLAALIDTITGALGIDGKLRARRNLLLNNQGFSPNISGSGITLTRNYANGPDGTTLTATRVVWTASANSYWFGTPIAFIPGVKYTCSAFVNIASATGNFSLRISDGVSANFASVNLNPSLGLVSLTSNGVATVPTDVVIQPWGNSGWYRISFATYFTSAITGSIGFVSTGGTAMDCVLYGSQIEEGTEATPLIINGGSFSDAGYMLGDTPSINYFTNSMMKNGIIGGTTLGTDVAIGEVAAGVTGTVVARDEAAGTCDIRFVGTSASANIGAVITGTGASTVPVTGGEMAVASGLVQLIAGTAPSAVIRCDLTGRNSGGSATEGVAGTNMRTEVATGNPTRVFNGRLFTDPTTVKGSMKIYFHGIIGEVVDFTVRISEIQLEKGRLRPTAHIPTYNKGVGIRGATGLTLGAFGLAYARTGALLKVLSAPAKQNFCLYSQDFGHTTWFKANCTIQDNVTTAPDGTPSADIMIPAAYASAFKELQQNQTFTFNNVYTMSIHAKYPTDRAGYRYVQLVGSAAIMGDWAINWDLLTGTETRYNTGTTNNIIARGFEDCGDGWYRIWVTLFAVGTGSSRVDLNIIPASNSGRGASWTGDGVSGTYVWGQQYETGPLSPYQGTNGQSTTRALLGLATTAMDATIGILGTLSKTLTLLMGSNLVQNSEFAGTTGLPYGWSAYISTPTITYGETDPNGGKDAISFAYKAASITGLLQNSAAGYLGRGQKVSSGIWMRADAPTVIYFGPGDSGPSVPISVTTSWQFFTNLDKLLPIVEGRLMQFVANPVNNPGLADGSKVYVAFPQVNFGPTLMAYEDSNSIGRAFISLVGYLWETLTEPAATNLLLNSANINASTWFDVSSTGSPLPSEGEFTPRTVASGSAVWHRRTSASIALTGGQQYTAQFLYKAGTSGKFYGAVYSDASNYLEIRGTIGGSISVTTSPGVTNLQPAVVTQRADGVYVCSCTFTPVSNWATATVGEGPNSLVTGETLIAYGMQVVAGNDVPFISTGATTRTGIAHGLSTTFAATVSLVGNLTKTLSILLDTLAATAGVSGTLSKTLAALGRTITGGVSLAGTLNKALGKMVLSSGTVTGSIVGTLSKTLGKLTVASSWVKAARRRIMMMTRSRRPNGL